MKAYQLKWFSCLQEYPDEVTLMKICQEIIEDDTGGTDPLTQILAERILWLEQSVGNMPL